MGYAGDPVRVMLDVGCTVDCVDVAAMWPAAEFPAKRAARTGGGGGGPVGGGGAVGGAVRPCEASVGRAIRSTWTGVGGGGPGGSGGRREGAARVWVTMGRGVKLMYVGTVTDTDVAFI